MSMNIEKHVSIIGSCISRDIFGFNNDKEFIVDRFIQSISPISAASNRLINVDYQTVMNDIRDEYCNINFYKRNFALDLTGRTFDYLYEYSSDYLLIDMAGCRYDILENNKGELLTRIRDLHQEEILSDFCKKYKVSSFDKLIDSEEDIQKLMDEYIPRYFDMILKAYKVDQIILLETDADVRDVFEEDGNIVIYAAPADLNKIKETLEKANITDFEMAETSYIPYETIELDEEQKEKFKRMMDMLDEAQDVQDVYHNVKL